MPNGLANASGVKRLFCKSQRRLIVARKPELSDFEYLESRGWTSEFVVEKSHFTALNKLEGSFTGIGGAGDSELIELSPKNVDFVEDHLRQAKAHHAEGSLEDAWFHLLQASNSLAYHRGVREGRFQASKVDRPARAGKRGGDSKAANLAEKLDAIAAKLKSHHAKSAFRTIAALEIQAQAFGKDHDMGSNQTDWLARLKKRPAMLALVSQLSSAK